jgi:hypothetical protein
MRDMKTEVLKVLSSNLPLLFVKQGDEEAMTAAQVQDSKLILDALGDYHALQYQVTRGDRHQVADKANQIGNMVNDSGAMHDIEASCPVL